MTIPTGMTPAEYWQDRAHRAEAHAENEAIINRDLRAALRKAGDELKAAACPYAGTQAHAAADLNG